jgi:hypothetical protein
MRRSASLLLSSLFLLTASASHAADPNNSKEAQRRFEEGKKLAAAGDCEHARLAFAQAAVLVRTPASIWEATKCEYTSRHYVEALNHARQLLREPLADKIDVEQAKTTMIPELVKKVGQIMIDAPDGAAIDVDKDYFGLAPLHDPVAVAPGHHKVTARTDKATLTQELDVDAGHTAPVILGSAPAPPAPTSATLDDVSSFLERPSPVNASPSGEPRDSPSRPNSEAARYSVSGAFAAGAVLLTASSVTLFVLAKQSDNDVRDAQVKHPPGSCPATGCADLDSALGARESRANVAWVLTGGAVVAALGAGVSWYLLRPKEHAGTGALRLTPTLSPGHAGLLLQSSF